ncbi:MAG: hypothetical protein CO042_03895 [Parcubacteria group bacterium CG_4_9_14_0_2_um_filter_41_8]|nr:MAG: hypothetical protein COW93_01420 [Parcubacteria group bacterium CG22_combo_CG10-13_8_21_14_all_41_9]PIQ80163.1 MAG: hypothetical protein COV79_01890 [Parcubacteria group bacterium CG11_big_fil_rev_8_21_14_0_20_41_14]PIR57141.1 MAG: hypothetical protein COU72_02465 [Parcubacteria group bacterium CG10_big_fil_rev_8_21_14_0_10_41_35]PJC40416.1 MAG: hypothetical protein CO042_03895 [Parcubacteria group bacterium CG_4_9_14_0_2_um_filter_41_8]
MPFNFFELLPSYQKSGVRRMVRKRRDIIAGFLSDDYRFQRDDPKKSHAIAAMSDSGILDVTNVAASADARLFGCAFEYLNASQEQRQKIQDKISSETDRVPDRFSGIRYLIEDNIKTWEQILELKAEQEKRTEQLPKSPEFPEHQATESSEDVVNSENADKEDVDLETLARNAAEFLPSIAQSFASIIPRLLTNIEELKRKLSLFSGQNQSLQQQSEQLLIGLQEAQNRAKEWEQYALELDEKNRSLTLDNLRKYTEDLAAGTAHGRRFLLDIDRFDQAQERSAQEAITKESPEGFPEKMQNGNFTGFKLVYSEKFRKDLKKRDPKDQERTRKALELFCEQGPYHNSFGTHSVADDTIQSLPEKSFVSRATDELRFGWRSEENKIICLYRLFREGEKEFYKSEF